MADVLKKILDLTAGIGFVKNNGSVSFGPLALLLANNIHREWFHSYIINTSLSVFLYNSLPNGLWQEDCKTSFHHILQLTNQLPFGLASVINDLNVFNGCTTSHDSAKPSTKAYRCLFFINNKNSQQYFYRLQHQRRMWWRKFSTDPERFVLTETKNSEDKEMVQISATFPWGKEMVETIYNHGSKPLTKYGSAFQIKSRGKKILPDVVESVCYERAAVMTYLCDAFQQLPSRTLLRFHHSLAPYKMALAIDSADEKVDELEQLATYLSLSLRKAGLHTFYSPANHKKKDLEGQFTNYDLFGVPYVLVLKGNTLINGIMGLRSRDTTLQEQVHVSSLKTYSQQLMNRSSL